MIKIGFILELGKLTRCTAYFTIPADFSGPRHTGIGVGMCVDVWACVCRCGLVFAVVGWFCDGSSSSV